MPTAYVTAPPEAADDIARTLVEEGLAACVNKVECSSVYRWDGEIHDDEEYLLLAKTTAERYPALEARVVERHPYEVPCVERPEESAVLSAFETWRAEATSERR